ncbi:hypothetical protein CRYUN_Cryun21dG0115000 [Craigia yunnanensis]
MVYFFVLINEVLMMQVSKMLKPEKWQATFDNEGKVAGFQKALKLIILGILWVLYLLSVSPFPSQICMHTLTFSPDGAKLERYMDLIKQCQTMHSSIGTVSLAYTVGSKVMDMRTSSKKGGKGKQKLNVDKLPLMILIKEKYSDLGNHSTDKSYADQRESSSTSADLISVRGNADTAAYDSCFLSTSGLCCRFSSKTGGDCNGSEFITECDFDFPPLSVTNLFEKSEDEKEFDANEGEYYAQYNLIFEEDNMHSFQINNNADLILESNVSPSLSKVSHALITLKLNWSILLFFSADRILPFSVVDVVRTDSHLEFYEDTRNLAGMSDILAFYAWVDPAIGYCQGMSDLLSPFIVLFEDNADAFWCFEMLIRRMRENFQIEGPTGVMKQLQALWHIMELTDREIFAHLSNIGAESLHFCISNAVGSISPRVIIWHNSHQIEHKANNRPLHVVISHGCLSLDNSNFELMMLWAADFDESVTCNLEEICLEALIVQLPRDSGAEITEENPENGNDGVKGSLQSKYSLSENEGIKAASTYHFCGLTRNFWSRNDHLQICSVVSSSRKGDDDLPVFCVAAILIMNRQKIIRETPFNRRHDKVKSLRIIKLYCLPLCLYTNMHSFECPFFSQPLLGMLVFNHFSFAYLLQIFNDKLPKFHVKRCIGAAIKLRKKYFYKLIKNKSHLAQNSE